MMAAAVSLPTEPCSHPHRRSRCLWAPLIFHHRRLLSLPAGSHRLSLRLSDTERLAGSPPCPIASRPLCLQAAPKMQPGCFPASPSLRPSLAVISLSPGSGTLQVRCPRAGTSSSTRRQWQGTSFLSPKLTAVVTPGEMLWVWFCSAERVGGPAAERNAPDVAVP